MSCVGRSGLECVRVAAMSTGMLGVFRLCCARSGVPAGRPLLLWSLRSLLCCCTDLFKKKKKRKWQLGIHIAVVFSPFFLLLFRFVTYLKFCSSNLSWLNTLEHMPSNVYNFRYVLSWDLLLAEKTAARTVVLCSVLGGFAGGWCGCPHIPELTCQRVTPLDSCLQKHLVQPLLIRFGYFLFLSSLLFGAHDLTFMFAVTSNEN